MPSDADLELVLKKAKEQEGSFNWLEAMNSYGQVVRSKLSNSSFEAEIWERMGFCCCMAARQTVDQEECEKLRLLSVEAYKNAAELFEKEDNLKSQGRSAQCKAIAAFVSSWAASGLSEKKETLDECLKFAKKSLAAYENASDELSYGKMCNELLSCLLERLYVASDWREMKSFAQEGIDYADKAIKALSKFEDKDELLRAYATACLQSWYAANISEQEEKGKELMQRSLTYSEKALELSKKTFNPYTIAMANWAAAICTLLFTEKLEASLEYAGEMLRQGTIVRDNYLKGVASYVLAFINNWMTLREADPDKKREGHERIVKYSEDAIRYLQLVSQDFFIAEVYLFYAESCSSLASDFEVGLEEKHAIFEKAVKTGREGLEHATRSGSPDATGATLHALSKALHFYSNLETEEDKKAKLLEEALIHRKEYNKIVESTFPYNDWSRGVGENYEGLIKAELAKLEKNKEKKLAFLEGAASDMEEGVSRCKRSISSRPVPTRIAATARFEDGFGGMLDELYALTENKKVLGRSIKAYEDAAKEYRKVGLPSRVAESYWKIAKNRDRLGKHHEASDDFENALAEYREAAQKIPHFSDFYMDHVTYMKAWSEIERAKSAHDKEEYLDSKEHYERVANLLKTSKLWSYLSSNFLAWALLEQSEDFSRKESMMESSEAFKEAAKLFEDAKEAFEKEVALVQNRDEKDKAIELGKASVRRKDYCLARAHVEEARISDREGNYAESAEKYDMAADALEAMLETLEPASERREIEPIACMCRAWQKMKIADGRVSPELYHEASELFLKAKDCSGKERTTLLAFGNSAFCLALEHGTRFEATREKEDFFAAKKYLGSAAGYYLKAGFDEASLWTNATEILFDAYNYMVTAEIESDPDKKTKAYLLAEKCLERSAGLYETVGYVGKRDEVLRILKKAREKSEFALSLRELIVAPNDASSTSVIPAPRLTVEEPVGLSKFERELVQANLIARQREVVVGETLSLEVQLANLGKSTAFLVGVEQIVPEEFDLVEKPERCTVTDGILGLKGRKLAPLETEEIKLTLRPKKKGKFSFTPKVQYVNEAGERKFCELEQLTVSVKELGIRGWLKGPG